MLSEIEAEIRNCKKCDLWKEKRNYVPGEGNPKAKLFLVGEAPGREEDLKGRPFVGSAGKYLTQLIERELGLRREDVFITNLLKCRPPRNRDPTEEEIKACSPYLIRQLDEVRPEIILCLGRHSARFLFNEMGMNFSKISRERGKPRRVRKWGKEVWLLATYHPAAALYHPELRKEIETDFQVLSNILRERKTLMDFFQFGFCT